MGILATISVITIYLGMALATKVYFNLYRHDGILNEEPYIVGFFWPIYWIVRGFVSLVKLAFSPFVYLSNRVEDKIKEIQLAKTKAKPRVMITFDRDLREAEDEVEDFLNREERYVE